MRKQLGKTGEKRRQRNRQSFQLVHGDTLHGSPYIPNEQKGVEIGAVVILGDLYEYLAKLAQGRLELPPQVRAIGLGYWTNMHSYLLRWDRDNTHYPDIVSDYQVFGTPIETGNETFIFSVDGEYLLEVFRLYPWLDIDPHDASSWPEGYIPFDEYMRNYPPGIKVPLSPSTVHVWKQIIENIAAFDLSVYT